jgi:nitrile hydratase subunit beta
MNGVHDMGGMHGMGPIQYESNEPVFHEPWEARVFALLRAMRASDKLTIDAFRHAVELIPAPEYLRMSNGCTRSSS